MNDAIGRNALEYIDSFLSTKEIKEGNRKFAFIAKTIEAKHKTQLLKQRMRYEMKDILIVVDMQNDFIDGSLGTKEAQAIVPNVAAKIKAYRAAGKPVIFTRDTHDSDYLNTHEGKNLPVPHCIAGTAGYEISPMLHVHDDDVIVNKGAFGYLHWEKLHDVDSIEICGLCTDICVVSNALILRSTYPEIDITVDASCCAGVTPDSHKAALTVMRSCQIEVIGE